ncbi:Activin receptor type-2A, partial [Halocaridina rubra]
MDANMRITRLSRIMIMMWMFTVSALPLTAANVLQNEDELPQRTMHCEQYNSTLCSKDAHQNSVCPGTETEACPKWDDPDKENHCFVVWTENEGKVEVTFKGCWLSGHNCRDECLSRQTVSSLKGEKNHIFCCCSGNYCNRNFSWDPAPEVPDPPSTTP